MLENSIDINEVQLRKACLDLERRLRSGEQCRAEDYLLANPKLATDPDVAVELIYAEFATREELGLDSSTEELCARFPDLGDRLGRLLEVHQALAEEDTHISGKADTSLNEKGQVEVEPPAGRTPLAERIGRYELQEEIARGGMGIVYKARHAVLGRTVALKIIQPARDDQVHRKRLLIEAEAAAQLQHPNIVQIFEVGEADAPYLALEFVSGGSLAAELAGKPLEYNQAVQIIEALARAIDYAHGQGIVHRDLKPANIMLTRDGVPKITDFGLAKHFESDVDQTQTGVLLGTPGYMSPEQAAARPKQIGTSTDIFSLGAIFYETLTGHPPFLGATLLDTLDLVRNHDPVPPSQLQPRLPKDLETICLKCLQKDTPRRYRSAGELAADLRRYLDGVPIVARPVGQAERLNKWVRRQPHLAAAIALLMLATTGLAFFAVQSHHRRNTAEANAVLATDNAKQARERELDARRAKQLADQRADELEIHLYASRMVEMQNAWETGRVLRAKQLSTLAQPQPGRPDLRGWEWHFQEALFRTEIRTFLHNLSVNDLVFDPVNPRLAVVSHGRMRIWDLETGTSRSLRGGGPSAVFSHDGRSLLSTVALGRNERPEGSPSTRLQVWDSKTGSRIDQPSDAIDRQPFLSNPDWLEALDQNDCVDLGSSTSHYRQLQRCNGSIAISCDKHRAIEVWSPDRQLIRVPYKNLSSGTQGALFRGADPELSPDRKLLAIVVRSEIQLWSVGTGLKLETLYGHQDDVRDIEFSPDGSLLLSGSRDKTVRLWDTKTATEIATVIGHNNAIESVTFNSTGTHFASASIKTPTTHSTIKLWSLPPNQDQSRLLTTKRGIMNQAKNLGASMPYRKDRIEVYRLNTGQTLWSLKWPRQIGSYFTFSDDGALFATASTLSPEFKIELWDLASYKRLRSMRCPKLKTPNRQVPQVRLAISPSNSQLAAGLADGSLHVWNVSGVSSQKVWNTEGAARNQWVSPDGKVSVDKTAVAAMAFTPDGRRLVTARGRDVTLWETGTGEQIATFNGGPELVTSLAFSPDGTTLAVGRWLSIELWSVSDQTLIHPAETFGRLAHQNKCVAFHPDGRRLACGDGGYVHIWDVSTGMRIRTLSERGNVIFRLHFSSDGERLYAHEQSGIRVWDAGTVTPELKLEREAQALVDFYSTKALAVDEIVAQIRKHPSIRTSVRERALAKVIRRQRAQ